MVLEYETRREKMKIREVLLVMGDGTDLEAPKSGRKLFILGS
jgi:hypothetical protein